MANTRAKAQPRPITGQTQAVGNTATNSAGQGRSTTQATRGVSRAPRPLTGDLPPVVATDIPALAESAANTAETYPLWLTKVGDISHLSVIDRTLSIENLSSAVTSVKQAAVSNTNVLDVETLLYQLGLGDIVKYLTRVIVMNLDRKKSTKTLRLLLAYKSLELFGADFNGAWAIVFAGANRPNGLYQTLTQLDKSDRLTATMRDSLQARARKSVSMPPEVSAMISGADKLNGAISRYINADDEEIQILRDRLKMLMAGKQKRTEEVSGLKKNLQEFNSMRGGVLTQDEIVTAHNQFATKPALREKFTIDGFLEIIRADKQKKALGGSLGRFSELASNRTLQELHGKSQSVKAFARSLLEGMGEGAIPNVGGQGGAPGGDEHRDELMDPGDDYDFDDAEGF